MSNKQAEDVQEEHMVLCMKLPILAMEWRAMCAEAESGYSAPELSLLGQLFWQLTAYIP